MTRRTASIDHACDACGHVHALPNDGNYGEVKCKKPNAYCVGVYRVPSPIAYWEASGPDVPHASDRWAVSARGWLFRDGVQSSLGHYLEYGPDHTRTSPEWCLTCPGPKAYRADYAPDPNRASSYCPACHPGDVHAVVVGRRSMHHPTPEAARAWIEAQLSLGPCIVNPATPAPVRVTPSQRKSNLS